MLGTPKPSVPTHARAILIPSLWRFRGCIMARSVLYITSRPLLFAYIYVFGLLPGYITIQTLAFLDFLW
jgi:hypothetical protein